MDFLKGLVGKKPEQAPIGDTDFADFAAAPDPSPVSIPSSPADVQAAMPTAGLDGERIVPYTKWYRVWERTQLSDFYMEAFLIPLIFAALALHFWGTSVNRKKARKWMAAHRPVLENEFALVGFNKVPKVGAFTAETSGLQSSGQDIGEDVLKEKTAYEFETYASGRQNVAFVDFRVILLRRMNPFAQIGEALAGLVIESVAPKPERMEAVVYPFDGNEKSYVAPPVPGAEAKSTGNSSYDPFVFAIVHKLAMRRLRDERYDISLTFTKDNAKLPEYATTMSESAEITELLLTKELISAIEKAGDLFEYLIVSDQPLEKPTTLDETVPKKRLHLSIKLPSNGDYSATIPLVQAFIRLPDLLVSQAHFRPEVLRKVTTLRDSEKAKLKKISDKETEEERMKQLDKMKKDERDRKMKGMSAEEQRKFLDREAEKSRKKQEKRMTRKG